MTNNTQLRRLIESLVSFESDVDLLMKHADEVDERLITENHSGNISTRFIFYYESRPFWEWISRASDHPVSVNSTPDDPNHKFKVTVRAKHEVPPQ